MSLRDQIRSRVRELVDEENLDEHLPEVEHDEALPWTLISSSWAGLALISTLVALVMGEWVTSGVLVVVAVALIVLSRFARTSYQRRRYRLGREGQIVPGALVQVDNNWLRSDNEESWGGMVVVSLDPAAEDDGGLRLQAIVSDLWELKESDRRLLDDDELRFAWTMYAEIGTKRRLRVPPALSHGLQDCWLLSTIIPVAPLRYGEILIYSLMLLDDEAKDAAAVLPVELALPV